MKEFLGPDPDDLEKVDAGSHIASILPFVETELDGMMHTVQVQVFAAIRKGTYTAEMGDNAWREMYGYYRLMKRLGTTARIGQHVGEKIADTMKIGDPHDRT